MTTNWALPTNVTQYSESGAEDYHVSWENINQFESIKFLDGRRIKTSRDLVHIARDPRHDIKEKTYYLKLTGFNFYNIPNNPTGIELKLNMNRYGRITDDTIQLVLNDNLIGENKATLDLTPVKVYGSGTDLWNTALTNLDLQNINFGIIIRFQSHPNWPHKCSPFIDAIELRIH